MPLRHAPAVSLILSRRVPVWMVRQPITMPMVRTLGFGWIAQARVDPGDVEHVLANLTLPPLERLRRSMRRARLGRSALSDAELALFPELRRANVQFIVVGLAAAVLQGADAVTKNVDLWFKSIADPDVVIHCDGLQDFATEYAASIEIAVAPDVTLQVLPIERVLVSKRAAGRLKDKAVIPALEAAIAAIKES